MRRMPVIALSVALLGGCGGAVAPTEIAALDGAWSGEIARIRGDKPECRQWGVEMVIRDGRVSGAVFDLRSPAARFTFDSYVETDGQMFLDARAGGDLMRVVGRFSRNSFSGSSTGGDCDGRVSLSRARG
jgi:uncharacterized protein YceK